MHGNIPIFDGHNDALLRLCQLPDPVAAFRHRSGDGHLDLACAKAGGFAGGIFACFVPSAGGADAGFVLTQDGEVAGEILDTDNFARIGPDPEDDGIFFVLVLDRSSDLAE
jgi:hypothetical protein